MRRTTDTLRDKVGLVTGATGGIGRAIVADLAARGMQVVLGARDADALDEVRRGLPDIAHPARLTRLDLADPETIEAAAASIGPVDVVVHAAGAYLARPLPVTSAEQIAHLFAVNVTGPARLTALLLPSLRARAGQVVFINSSAVDHPAPGVEAYAGAKFAQAAFARNLRREVNPDGVRVLIVYPGRTATQMQEAIHAAEGRHYEPGQLVQPTDIARMIGNILELPPTAEVTDLHVRPAARPRSASMHSS